MTVLLAFTIFLLAIASGIAGIMLMEKRSADGALLMTSKMFAEAKQEQQIDINSMARMEKSLISATETIERLAQQLHEVRAQVERITGQPQAETDVIETLRAMRKRPALAPKPESHGRVTVEITPESLDAMLSMSDGIPRAGVVLVPEGIEGIVTIPATGEAFTAALTEEFKTYQPEPVQ